MTDLANVACIEAEAALLGAAMQAPAQAARILDGLTADDFAEPRHRDVLAAISRLHAAGALPDPVTVLGEMRRAGELPSLAHKTHGVQLHDLLQASSGPAMAGHYRRIVLEHSWRRRVAEAGVRLTQAAPDAAGETLADIVGREVAALLAATARITAPATEGATAA